MFGMGPWELVLILVIALVIFGPGKLPEVGQALGKGLKEFKRASNSVKEGIKEEVAAATAEEQEAKPALEKAGAH